MDWKDKIKEIASNDEFQPQKDWNDFNSKYRHFKKIKFLKNAAAVVSGIVVIGTVLYFALAGLQNQNKVIPNNKVNQVVNDNSLNTNKINETVKVIDSDNNKSSDTQKLKTTNAIANKQQKQNLDSSQNTSIKNEVTNNEKGITTANNTQPKPEKVISAEFTISKNAGCMPLKTIFTPKVLSDSAVYLWEFGDGTFSNEKIPTHIYNSEGIFTISLTTKHYRGSKLNVKKIKNGITVYAKPKAEFSFDEISTNNIQTDNLSTNYELCQWYLDGFLNSNDKSPQFILENGKHSLTLVICNKICKDSLVKTVEIKEEMKMFAPNAFTPNGDNQNDEFKPVFNIEPVSYKMLIFDKWGKVIFSTTNIEIGWNGKINDNDPQEGIYMWNIIYQYKNAKPIEKNGQVKLIQ